MDFLTPFGLALVRAVGLGILFSLAISFFVILVETVLNQIGTGK